MMIKFQVLAHYLAAGILISTAACSDNNKVSSNTPGADSTQSAPVETNDPNTKYQPAFPGQTRIGAVKTTTPFTVTKLADGIERPFAVVPLPDGRLLVTSKLGYMELRDSSGALVKKITGFPKVEDGGQGGLLDVAPDPDFSNNQIIYWSFSEKYEPGNLTAIAKGTLNEAAGKVDNPTVIFRATPALKSDLHFGSRLVFDKEGNLYASAGERSILEGRAQAQLLTAGLGKVFKLTKDGKAAAGNPFAGQSGAMPEIFAYGIRNPQGLDINPATGELWQSEFGPRGGDEINIIRAGKNYGWPVITYGIEYSGEPIGGPLTQQDGMEQPVYYWDPVVSPSGITFYKGNAIPEWENNLFVGALSGQHIVRLVIKDDKVVGEERLLADEGERFRDVAYLNGSIYAITDNGNLYRVGK